MRIKALLLHFLLCFALSSQAEDLTRSFELIYKNKLPLTNAELEFLRQHDFYLAPGILSETFIQDDHRSVLDFSILTREYFSSQYKLLMKLHIPVTRLSTSSYSVVESRKVIREVIKKSASTGRKSFFITHSLGGLALFEELLERKDNSDIGGIIFIQSPFYGAPVADVYLENPYSLNRWLKPVLPFFNTSEETLHFLSTSVRRDFMLRENEKIQKLIKEVPIMTVAGEVNGFRSLFRPSVDLIQYGCVRGAFGRCLTSILFAGPYDQSDGMVPVESSKLKGTAHVILKGVDHGETVVNVPFENYSKRKMTEALLKLFLCNNQARTSTVSHVCPGPLEKPNLK